MASKPPFDVLAPTYDLDFTASPIARILRAQAHERLTRCFPPGSTVLELGCGTGEDALALAERGVRVIATDSSAAMLERARAKTAHQPLVTVAPLDLAALPPVVPGLDSDTRLDGVFSNFGPLNCIADLRPLAAWLSTRVKPDGMVALGMMSRYCLWEMLWNAAHADFKTAFRRLPGASSFRPQGAGETIVVTYPSPRRLEQDFAPWFRRVHLRGLGLFLPPTGAFAVVEKRPRLLKALTALEARFARYAMMAPFADHYWIEMVRVQNR